MPRNGSGTYALPPSNPTVPGTVISSGGWWNPTSNDLATAITQSLAYDGQTVPIANLPMGNFRHTNVANAINRNEYATYGQVQDGQPQWMTVTGTDTILGTIAPGPTGYVAGQSFRFVPAGPNTTNAVTLNINALGAKNITKNGTNPLAPGDLAGGTVIEVIYDGTRFQLMAGGSVLTGHGQCRLAATSTTVLKLSPFNGSSLIIGGVTQQIPSAGVTYTLSGLAASTLYYVYAFMNAGTMTLEVVTTAHSTGTNGVEIKTGDATRTLVGMVRTNGSTLFADTATQRFTRSYFNDPGIDGLNWFTANRSTTSGSFVELNTEIRIEFISWADDVVTLGGAGISTQTTAPNLNSTVAAIDGTLEIGTYSAGYGPTNNFGVPYSFCKPRKGLSEGYHYFTLFGKVGGGTGTWSGGAVTTSNPDGCTLTLSAKH